MHLELTLLPENFAICRLPAGAPWPRAPRETTFFSVTRTAAELSVVCETRHAPAGARIASDWRVLALAGPLEFGSIGILAALAVPLAHAAVAIFVLSTYDTDCVLIRQSDVPVAVGALRAAGHRVSGAAGG